jgi:hypothetical protein
MDWLKYFNICLILVTTIERDRSQRPKQVNQDFNKAKTWFTANEQKKSEIKSERLASITQIFTAHMLLADMH